MLYLEDYLEMIEHLPQELRDRFTEMRELDLTVQNSMDTLDKRVKNFFGQCKRAELPQSQADNEYVNIRKDYYKVLEDSDEKVQIANQMYDLVERYLRRLDSELHKFKCELEADNHGITDILEKRSLELDGSTNGTTQKENRFYTSSVNQTLNTPSTSNTATPRYRPKQEKRRDSGSTLLPLPAEKRQALNASLGTPTMRPTTPNLNQVLQATPTQTVPFSDNTPLIVAAAAQAIEKTQQMQQGRRTASLKASYEAIQSGVSVNPHELLMGRELTSSSSHTLQAIEREVSSTATSSSQKRHKKKNSKLNKSLVGSQLPQASTSTSSAAQLQQSLNNDSDELNPMVLNENGMVVEQTPDGEWTYDPNEPRYCICNQVSYGEMVACDNEDCTVEWFHYPCVGIETTPKGKWYCPKCTETMRRRGYRKY